MTAILGNPIQQIAPQVSPSVEQLLRQITQTMTPSVDTLINQLLPLKPSGGISLLAAAKAGVIEAVVLSNSPLIKSSNGEAQIKVTLSVDKQQYELSSKLPLPIGARVLLKVAGNNLAVLLNIVDTTTGDATKTAATTRYNGQTTIHRLLTSQQISTSSATASNRSNTNSPGNITATVQQTIEQAVRQTLPQQQALKIMLPLLQQIVQQPPQWPKELTQNISHLLKQFPTSEQMQQPLPLKQAIKNSGLFFEAKLAQPSARLVKQGHGQATTRLDGTETRPDIKSDIKGMMQSIIPQIEKASGSKLSPTSVIQPAIPTDVIPTYTDKPTERQIASATQTASRASTDQNLDVQLRQLGRQLMASIARTQLNQLESLGIRKQNSTDNQGPINSWNLEIPIVHGNQVDNLQLRIKQQEQEATGKEKQDQQKLWAVTLNFDLHNLGKMNVQLKIIGNTVAAIIWSQLEQTHREVKQQIQDLKKNLQKVGVIVKQVDCQLGLPPKANTPLYHQLVDVRT
ncbi:MAG: flagellar hook-length control protein FliK [Pseudomonadales bacterium]